MMTPQELIDFEEDIAKCFNERRIKAPIHLYSNNETQMLEVFEKVKKEDWVFCSWRSHYQCLLKGVPKEKVKEEILNGHSISLCFPSYKVYSSAIVGGSIPIALGAALGLKRKGSTGHVWCFVGDMTAETGGFHEALKYSQNFNLPITFVIEDNSKSVCTDTLKTWGKLTDWSKGVPNVIYYKYANKWPHAGSGERIQF